MRKTILVVDDSAAEVKMMLAALEGRGYDVFTASDGEEAITQTHLCHPDLVLLDIVLPKRNGYQVCRELKGLQSPPKVIMVSSKNQKSDRFWGMKQGAYQYITKPIDQKILASAVEQLL